jgi:hypothetical protein
MSLFVFGGVGAVGVERDGGLARLGGGRGFQAESGKFWW